MKIAAPRWARKTLIYSISKENERFFKSDQHKQSPTYLTLERSSRYTKYNNESDGKNAKCTSKNVAVKLYALRFFGIS